MGNIDYQFLKNELLRQNPWWQDKTVLAEDPLLPKRCIYEPLAHKVLEDELITAVTGLRRIGKTTLIKQIINELLDKDKERQKLLYFSFEEISLAKNPRLLEDIIEYQVKKHPTGRLFFFFDEIQYVDFWNAVLKKYFDTDKRLKFVVTGSSSLFIKTKARESLAGRILETVMRPFSYGEYLRIVKNIKLPQNDFLSAEKFKTMQYILKENFTDYLSYGEFPYLSKLESFSDRKQYVLDWVIGKIVENDLPRMRRFVHTNVLINLCDILISGSGQLVELKNLADDMGLDRKTLSSYLELLGKTHIIKPVYNLGAGFRTRNFRQRKIYSSSVNAVVLKKTEGPTGSFNLLAGQIAENFVFNYFTLKEKNIYFWRQRNKEIDFLLEKEGKILPVEVKYQSKIKQEDIKTILYFCRKKKLKEAIIISRDEEKEMAVSGVKIKIIPAYFLV